MSIFIENLKKYISENRYKQSYVAEASGIEVNKFSRIINEKQSVTEDDMILISDALGRDVDYFLAKNFKVNKKAVPGDKVAGFYIAGSIDEEINKTANEIFGLMENFSAIVGAKERMKLHFEREAARGL